MRDFKVFYSWQSDLPKNETSSFIQKCINDAIKKASKAANGIEIIADRDTKGLTGSPTIPQTILEKIDECEIFIADISLVNKYKSCAVNRVELQVDTKENDADSPENENEEIEKGIKYTPNPNVLIELGYAIKRLGWSRIICFINTDYGRIEDLPFDIDHQRVTDYSLKNSEITKVKKELSAIITYTILEFAEKPPLPKKGKAYHIIGSYNPSTKNLDDELVAYDVRNCSWIKNYLDKSKDKARSLISEVKTINIPVKSGEIIRQRPKHDLNYYMENQEFISSLAKNDFLLDYEVSKSDRDEIIELAGKFLQLDSSIFDDAFFNVGSLKLPMFSPISPSVFGEKIEPEKQGGEMEKKKEKTIQELLSVLWEMNVLEVYIKTFNNMHLFPLAIENTSAQLDTNIEIVISIEGGKVVWPNEDLIADELKEQKIDVYMDGFPMCLLMMNETGDIKYEGKMWYDSKKSFYGNTIPGFPLPITSEDYGYAMQMYIKEPFNENEYIFNISNLKAGERKWLGAMIAVSSDNPQIKISYSIKSDTTDGNNEGELVFTGASR